MNDEQRKHRVIGIRHALKNLKDAGLISEGVNYPDHAVGELLKILAKANGGKRFRVGRSDASIKKMTKSVETVFGLPEGSVKLIYPTGRRARADSTIGAFKRYWERH